MLKKTLLLFLLTSTLVYSEPAKHPIELTREQLLEEVNHTWKTYSTPKKIPTPEPAKKSKHLKLKKKLAAINIPLIQVREIPLDELVNILTELSREHDHLDNHQGVNIVVIDPDAANPEISIALRNLTLDRILDLITQKINFQHQIEEDVIIIEPFHNQNQRTHTRFFPISRATIGRILGYRELKEENSPTNTDLKSKNYEEAAFIEFLEKAGIHFTPIHGSGLAYDGTHLIVTQTLSNLDKIELILGRYQSIKQVQIETKFLEVKEGLLEELGTDWQIGNASNTSFFQTVNPFEANGTENNTNLRTLINAFKTQNFTSGTGSITGIGTSEISIPNQAPGIPGTINLGSKSVNSGAISGSWDGVNIRALVKALEQETGSDLMSAPKLTVLSGKTARIVVAQELRYPQSYGDTRAEVSTTAGATSGSGGVGTSVAITAGTPQDFVVRNVGVEMEVTPIVEQDDSIHLVLEPQVTEFEGFVEYGGQSIAISGGITTRVPSGFFQPIFSTRSIRTEVTIQDGATIIMGGLTREEVVSVHDKVPGLHRIPILGKLLFQSKGDSSQKRNLLIVVTAKIISPEGEIEPVTVAKTELQPITFSTTPKKDLRRKQKRTRSQHRSKHK